MKHSININANIKISEYYKAETEVDADIYRQEFAHHYIEYLKTNNNSELIFTFILLQIYVECFLHQNMRRIVCFEFKPPRNKVCTTWTKNERKSVEIKINSFIYLFFNPVPVNIKQLVDVIV